MTKLILSRLLATPEVLFEHQYISGKSREVGIMWLGGASYWIGNVISSLNSDVSCEIRTTPLMANLIATTKAQ